MFFEEQLDKIAAVIPAFKSGSKILTRFEDRHSGVGVRGDTSEKTDEESRAEGGGIHER